MSNGIRTGYEGNRPFSRLLLTNAQLLLPCLIPKLVKHRDLFLQRLSFGFGQWLLIDLHHKAYVCVFCCIFVESVIRLDRNDRWTMNFSWPISTTGIIIRDKVLQGVLIRAHRLQCSSTFLHLLCSSAQAGALLGEHGLMRAQFSAGPANESLGEIVQVYILSRELKVARHQFHLTFLLWLSLLVRLFLRRWLWRNDPLSPMCLLLQTSMPGDWWWAEGHDAIGNAQTSKSRWSVPCHRDCQCFTVNCVTCFIFELLLD